jgi:hypothetical protein
MHKSLPPVPILSQINSVGARPRPILFVADTFTNFYLNFLWVSLIPTEVTEFYLLQSVQTESEVLPASNSIGNAGFLWE